MRRIVLWLFNHLVALGLHFLLCQEVAMKLTGSILALAGALLLWPAVAHAHCDAIDGPVATAAIKALEMKNVNLILPYAPAAAEPEMTAAFEQAVTVRAMGPEAKTLADRYFMETAVRLHRAGENAPYTGLRPAGTDFGPAIPAAERAVASGRLEPLVGLLTAEIKHGLAERFAHAVATKSSTKEPEAKSGVAAARERVSAELAFIGYVEGIYQAIGGGAHAE
jgi:hypothetical protein